MTIAFDSAGMLEATPVLALKRPRILSSAARAGARLYSRDRDLSRILPGLIGRRRPADILRRLSGLEAQCEEARRDGAADYSSPQHVQVLAALVAEATRVPAAQAV